jgi:transcriptional regulator
MLVHPWDASPPAEWRDWLAGRDFGQLIAPGRNRDLPVVTPIHFVLQANNHDDNTVLMHLARPNPIWKAFDEHPRALLTVIGDYTYIPSEWNSTVPTSYYATVQLEGDVRVIDDPAGKAALLNRQLDHFEPGMRPPVEDTERLLPGIRGIELTVTGATAKFKFGGNKTAEHRAAVAERLINRDAPFDRAAARHVGERLTQPG